MKKINIILIVGFLALCGFAWYSMIGRTINAGNEYDEYIVKADEYVKEGLYHRAIESYEKALKLENSEELSVTIATIYEALYKETPEVVIDNYVAFLEKTLIKYPANSYIVNSLVPLYRLDNDYEKMYNCVKKAIDKGYKDKKAYNFLREAKYAYDLKGSVYSAIKQSIDGMYSVKFDDGWNVYSDKNGFELIQKYSDVGLYSKEGILAVKDENNFSSRLIDKEGFVYGIFKDTVTDAGVYSEGLIPAKRDGKYYYYDEYAHEQFGGYAMAGMFQEGKAAVESDGKWYLIDSKGTIVSEKYERIILGCGGQYLVDGKVLVKNMDGSYCICNKEMKIITELKYENIDIYTPDGLIAVCQGGKWGFVTTTGEVLIKPVYDEAKSFSNGLAAVKKDDMWGFIDTDNNLVIPYQYSDVGYMDSDGICPVRVDTVTEEDKRIEWKFLQLLLGIREE